MSTDVQQKVSFKSKRGKRNRKGKVTRGEVKQLVKQALCKEAERKYKDNSYDSIQTAPMSLITHVTAVAQGNSVNTRVGNDITLLSLHFRMTYKQNAAATSNLIRFVIVQDVSAEGSTQPTAAQIFQSSSDWQSPLNRNTAGTYKVLYDESVSVDNGNGNNHMVKEYINLKQSKCTFNGANATDEERGHIYVFVGCGADITNLPSIEWYQRLVYCDM